MAANSFYNPPPLDDDKHEQQQHLLHSAPPPHPSAHASGPTTPLKPLQLLASTDTGYSNAANAHYANDPMTEDFETVKAVRKEDARLKSRIRRLRILSRTISLLISIAILIPIALTVHKFLSTRTTLRTILHPDGTSTTRTAWAKDSKTWPTYMYFATAATAVLLNGSIIFSYKCGVQQANRASNVASVFSWAVLVGNLVVWSVAAGLYRSEKDKGGKSNDLWGWTCSPAARAIQKEFVKEVNFERFCNVQSVSFYIGIVQVVAALLSIVIYVLALFRRSTKKKIQKQAKKGGF